jgi:hypothetical protein
MQGKDLDLWVARQNVELLELMEAKTSGNRTPEESSLLEQLLFQLRMAYVEAEKKTGASAK